MALIYNSRCSIFRDVIGQDQVGGMTVITGTVVESDTACRLDFYIPFQKLVGNQGLETEKVYSMYIRSTRQHPIDAKENDYIVVTFPPYHPEINNKFRIRGIQRESLSVGYSESLIECSLTRIVESRSNDF